MNSINDIPVAITLTIAEWQIVLNGLAELPYKFSAEIVTKVNHAARAGMENAQRPNSAVEPLPVAKDIVHD